MPVLEFRDPLFRYVHPEFAVGKRNLDLAVERVRIFPGVCRERKARFRVLAAPCLPGVRPLLALGLEPVVKRFHLLRPDRKSTRLNSSHSQISYAVFCLKKKK